MTRDDLAKFRALEIDFEALGLLQDETPAAPFAPVRQMQAAFDPGSVPYSDEYYDVLGLEPTERRDEL